MALQFNLRNSNSSGCQATCLSKDGCPSDRCPDFVIKRHDTQPVFKVRVEDCDGPLNIQGLVVEVNMWAKGKLKQAITTESTYFSLADNIGFEQIMIGDVIIMDRVRLPEYMLVTAFDEDNYLVQVQRGYRGTTVSNWKKGTKLRIFRTLNSPAQTELIFEDISNLDGTVEKDVLTDAFLVYQWQPSDTCLPGCYWLEFKLLKMADLVLYLPGGYWVGPIHQEDDGFFYTGSEQTESSVRLSYDGVNDKYYLSSNAWTGDSHVFSDSHYTGIEQNDGSVYLDRTDKPFEGTIAISSVETENDDAIVSALALTSITPSFTSEELTDNSLFPYYFGCILGEGVESERRFPIDDEGFLIKIVDNATREF
jgi:hypothetical protein